MASIDELIDQHGEGTVRKAFWLQEHIFEEGIEGVHFSKEVELNWEITGENQTKREIESELKDSY